MNKKAKFGKADPDRGDRRQGRGRVGIQPIQLLAHSDVADFVAPLPAALQSYNHPPPSIRSNGNCRRRRARC